MVHDFLPRIGGSEAACFGRAGFPGVGGIDASLGGLSRRVYRPGPARHGETCRGQKLEIVRLFDMAIADVASGLVAFPNQAGVFGFGVFLRGIDERRVSRTALEQLHRRIVAHGSAGTSFCSGTGMSISFRTIPAEELCLAGLVDDLAELLDVVLARIIRDPLVGRVHFCTERREVGPRDLHSGLLQLVDLIGFGIGH
jgi:hypothetical protein